MQIKALRTFRCDAGTVRRDMIVDVSPAYAKTMIARGLAAAVDKPTKPKPAAPVRAGTAGAAAPKGE